MVNSNESRPLFYRMYITHRDFVNNLSDSIPQKKVQVHRSYIFSVVNLGLDDQVKHRVTTKDMFYEGEDVLIQRTSRFTRVDVES